MRVRISSRTSCEAVYHIDAMASETAMRATKMEDSKNDRTIKGTESIESRDDEKEESTRKQSPKCESVTATDITAKQHDDEAKSADKASSKRSPEPALIVEINKHTDRLDKVAGKKRDITVKSDATVATKPSSNIKTSTRAEPENPKKATTDGASGAVSLAQAALQTSSIAVPAPLKLPHVTPPSLPQDAPPDSPLIAARKRRGIPHTYRDYSNEPDCLSFVRKRAGGVTKPFPEKLHELLTSETDAQDVVEWLPHGRAFIVRKPKLFTSAIMGKYFRQTKLTSFQRQLNLYGFRRITQGPDAGAYYHELFLKGRPQLCLRMQRQKVKGTGHKLPADAETEPNFYNMPSSMGAAEESPGMQGLRGAANLLQGISAGLPPAALLPKPALAHHHQGTSMMYSTASTTNPQHWQYASAVVARHAALVKKETAQGRGKGRATPPDVAKKQDETKKEDRKNPPLQDKDQSHGDKATDIRP